jgi:hypothetical protein
MNRATLAQGAEEEAERLKNWRENKKPARMYEPAIRGEQFSVR